MAAERAHWGSRFGFILAAAGSAVGLGNIWKFPYITGENGGGLFVIIYLVCIALVGLPILMAEIMIGRAAQKQTVAAFHELEGRMTPWAAVGWMGVITGFLILSFYVVVAGWAMDFTLKSVVNFTNPIHERAEVEAATYRATADLDEMRAMLSADLARSEAADAIAYKRNDLKPSVWDGYGRFTAALDAADDKDEAERRLLLDESLSGQVQKVRALLPELDEIGARALADAQSHYEGLSEEQLLDEAEEFKRREATLAGVTGAFLSTASDGWTATLWALVFMVITIIIVARGVSSGIERTCRILFPTLIVLMVIMVILGATKQGFGEALSFVFKPDIQKLEASGVLEALGHAFFTLSLGMGAMITYGSYQKVKEKIIGQAVWIAGLDTLIALLACMMIFPIVFSYGQEAGAGPGLVFMSMPLAFAEMGSGGMLFAILFFGLLVFAALTSSISLLEVVASYFIDERGWPRVRAAWVLGGVVFLVAIPSAFALDPDVILTGWEPSFGQNFFDTMDYLTSNWLLPLGGLFIAIYAGWIMPKRMRDAEVADASPLLYTGWLWLVRILAPALVVVVLLQKVGFLDADELLHGLFH